MRSVIGTNPVTRAAAAFLVGGLAVLVVHQPVVGLLHALGSTPIMPYNLRATQPWGIPVSSAAPVQFLYHARFSS